MDIESVHRHLRDEYAGVFAPGQVERHLDEYVALEPARALVELISHRVGPGARILDLGCGYGSFVTAARQAGFEARGIELAGFEVAFARERLGELRPTDDPESAFTEGDARRSPYADGAFEVVTMWNVVEHVPDYRDLLAEAVRLLRPGGWLFAIAPNYAALRYEAHYHVPWLPLLPRRLGSAYLSALGRDPTFFESSIHYCTNTGVRRTLRNLGMEIADRRSERLADPKRVGNPRVRRAIEALGRAGLDGVAPRVAAGLAENPLAATINVEARKPNS